SAPTDRGVSGAARRAVDQGEEIRKQMAALVAQDERIEKVFNAALHTRVLGRRQSQAYRAMLGPPFDAARTHDGPAGAGADRGRAPDAKRPTSSARGLKPGR